MTPSEASGSRWPQPPHWDPATPPPPPPTRAPVALHEPARTSPLTILLELAGLVTLGIGLALALWTGGGPEVAQLGLGVVVIGTRVAGWAFRTYTVTDRELVLDEGILQKRHRAVPFSRIQQVELRQQLTARLFGITTVHIETAADAGGTAVSLRSLELRQAEALRDHLLAEQRRVRQGTAPAAPDDPGAAWSAARLAPPRQPLVRLSPVPLLLSGATSSGTVAASVATVVAMAVGATVLGARQGWGPSLTFAVAAAGAIVATLAIATLNAFGSMVRYWDYDLSASGDDLHLSHGLLDRRQHTMPRHRLQHARLVDNPLRRALGTTALDLYSAATPGRSDQQQGHVEIPVLRHAEVADVLVRAMGDDRWRPPALVPRPAAARRRAVVRRVAITTGLVLPVAIVGWPAGAGVLPLALLGLPWGRLAHRRAGSALGGDIVALASGAVVHHLELIPVARLQSARTSSSVLQRRAGLATLHLDVAGRTGLFGMGSPRLADLAEDDAAAALHRGPRS